MDILKRGIPPSERTYIADCRTCKSQIKFKRTEAKLTSDQRDGDYLNIVCPVCGAGITKALGDFERTKDII